MLRRCLSVLLVVLPVATLAAQAAVTTADFSGTWNIEFMSHQIALVIEPKDASHVTATMMMMGRDLALKGELKDRTLTLVADRSAAGADGAAASAGPAGHDAPTAPADAARHGTPAPRPIVVTLQPDGTISGEMMTNQGPGTWTGERLRKRK